MQHIDAKHGPQLHFRGIWSCLSDSIRSTPQECVCHLHFKPTLIDSSPTPPIPTFFNASHLTSLEEVTLSVDCRSCLDILPGHRFHTNHSENLIQRRLMIALRLLQSLPRQRGDTAFKFLKFTTFSIIHSEPPASASSIIMQFLNQHADTLKIIS